MPLWIHWPYNSSTSPPADAIIRTADNVDFHVHKVVLSLASPIFDSMFALPQPSTQDSGTTKDDLPVIPVSEIGTTIHSLLCYVYPMPDPLDFGLDNLNRVFGAAIKYELTESVQLVKGALCKLIRGEHTSTLDVFAVGCRHRDEGLAMQSAFSWRAAYCSRIANERRPSFYRLGEQPKADSESFAQTVADLCYVPTYMAQRMSAGTYFRLVQYIQDGKHTLFLNPPSELAKPVARKTVEEALAQHPFTRKNADLVFESSDGVRFPVQRAILACNLDAEEEDVFESLIKGAIIPKPNPDSANARSNDLPIARVEESSKVLCILLTLCYPPSPGNTLQDQSAEQICDDTMICVVKAAQKYKFASVVHAFRARLEQLITQDPLRAYCVACALRWKDEAKGALARLVFRATPLTYLPIYESLSAKDYYILLKRHWECQSIIRAYFLARYPLAQPTETNEKLRSAPRSTWLTREDIPSCTAAWPALLEAQIDAALSTQRNDSNRQKNGVGAFDWDSMVRQMADTESHVLKVLQDFTLSR